jgi:hypothetical protein
MFKVEVRGLKDFTIAQEDVFLNDVIPLLEKVANSGLFKRLVLDYDQYMEGFKKPYSSKFFPDHSNKEIYNLFMSGADKFNPEPDNDMDLFLTSYYSRKNVVGYTYPSTFKTWVNRKFFVRRLKSKNGHAKIIGNIIHEYMHNLGFSHNKRWNSTRKHTVPYAYGRIAEEVARWFIYEESL